MEKRCVFFLLLFFAFQASAYVVMPRINEKLFIANPETDFSKIEIQNPALKVKMVRFLFDNTLIDHIGTKSYDADAQFLPYYKAFEKHYRLIDINHDQVPELIFSGYVSEEEDSEMFQIFVSERGELKIAFQEKGHLLAYKIQPNTQEVLLFHHQYPCCENASHNINRLRLVKGSIQQVKRYFVARDTKMKGNLFPNEVSFNGKFKYTKTEKTPLYWSNSIITKDAWIGRTASNLVANYPIKTPYTILATEGDWNYVIMHGSPLVEENRVINPSNFTQIWVYGWIKKAD